MAGSASKERNGRKMSMVVAKNKAIRGHKARANLAGIAGGGLVNYHHVPRSPPTVVPLSFLLLRPCRPALSHAIFRQHRYHILPHSPTQGIHHRRASGGLGFHMVNTDVRYKTPSNSFLTPPSQPSACLQAISIPGTRVLCHGLFTKVHPRSHACV
jgi:hypothetical protein